MANVVELAVRAWTQQAKQEVAGLTGQLGALGRQAGIVTGIFGAVAAGFVVKFFKDAAVAAREEQAVMAILAEAIENVGVSYGSVSERTEAWLKATERLTGYQDDVVAAALARAVQITGDYDTALRTVETSTELARARGEDLLETTTKVARGVNGSTTGLQRMGVELAKGAQGTAVLDAIQARYAGSVEAYMSTAAGATERYKAAIDNLYEGIGTSLLPVLASGATMLAGWAEAFNDLDPRVRNAVVVGGLLAAALTGVALILPAVIAGFAAMGISIGAVLPIAAAVVVGIWGIVEIVRKAREAVEVWGRVWERVWGAAESFLSAHARPILNVIATIGASVRSLIEYIMSGIRGLLNLGVSAGVGAAGAGAPGAPGPTGEEQYQSQRQAALEQAERTEKALAAAAKARAAAAKAAGGAAADAVGELRKQLDLAVRIADLEDRINDATLTERIAHLRGIVAQYERHKVLALDLLELRARLAEMERQATGETASAWKAYNQAVVDALEEQMARQREQALQTGNYWVEQAAKAKEHNEAVVDALEAQMEEQRRLAAESGAYWVRQLESARNMVTLTELRVDLGQRTLEDVAAALEVQLELTGNEEERLRIQLAILRVKERIGARDKQAVDDAKAAADEEERRLRELARGDWIAGLMFALRDLSKATVDWIATWTEGISSVVDAALGAFRDVVSGARTFGDAMVGVFQNVVNMILNIMQRMLAQAIVQWFMRLFGIAGGIPLPGLWPMVPGTGGTAFAAAPGIGFGAPSAVGFGAPSVATAAMAAPAAGAVAPSAAFAAYGAGRRQDLVLKLYQVLDPSQIPQAGPDDMVAAWVADFRRGGATYRTLRMAIPQAG